MDIETTIKERIIKAIRQAFSKSCPLIGDKWFKHHRKGKPADFEFTGMPKLSKATSLKVDAVTRYVLKNLDLSDLNVTMTVTDSFMIYIDYNQAKGEDKGEDK